MIVSMFITLALGLAVLATLLNAAASEMYMGRPPSGADAMGLATPILCSGLGWIMTLIAAWLCVWRGGFDWLAVPGVVRALIVTLGVAGIGIAAFACFLAWCERVDAVRPPLRIGGGLVAPLALQLILAVFAWAPARAVAGASWPGIAAGLLVPVALAGLGIGGFYGVKHERRAMRRIEQQAAERAAEEQARAAQAALPRIEQLRRQLASWSPSDPLWRTASMLTDESDADCRDLIVSYALRSADFDAQLMETLACRHSRLRAACAELVGLCPDARPHWAPWLAEAARLTSADIDAAGMLEGLEHEDYAAQVRSLCLGAEKVWSPELRAAMAALHEAIARTSDEPARSASIESVQGVLDRHS